MNSKLLASDLGLNQEYRDWAIKEHFGVETPYVLFSMNHRMDKQGKKGREFPEMVVYTQIHQALFGVIELKDKAVKRIPKRTAPHRFLDQSSNWSIVFPPLETILEIQKKK
jgi:hypothetical protein